MTALDRSALRIAAAMAVAVGVPNYGYEVAAVAFGGSEPRWQYILEGFSLMFVLSLLALAFWANVWVRFACGWGVFEAWLKGACGLLRLHDTVFAPDGYVCRSGEALSLVGALAGLMLAWGIWHAAKQ